MRLSSGIRHPRPIQRVPLCTILRYPFLVMDPKNFLWPMYFNFEGGARAEKTRIFGQNISKKCLKRLFGLLFSKFCLRRKNYGQNSLFSAAGELGKSIWSTWKKKHLWKIRLFPRDNPRSATVCVGSFFFSFV